MTLRITRVDGEGAVLRIDGRLDAEGLAELERACEEVRRPLTLNLEGLLWVDDLAAQTLLRLKAEGATLANASPYTALLLERTAEKVR